MLRKTLALGVVLIVAATTVLSGCTAKPSADRTSAPQNEKVVLKLGHTLQEDHPLNKAALKFSELVKEGTQGRVEVQVFPNSQLGGEKDIVEGVKVGSIDLFLVAAGILGRFEPSITIMDAPYVWRDFDHLKKAMRGPIGEEIGQKMSSGQGLRVLDFAWYYGLRHLTANKPVMTPADAKGMKIRTPPSPINIACAKVLGGIGTPMNPSELYMALKEGVVDAQENPLPTIYTMKTYEVQKYIMLTGHLMQSEVLGISEKVFQKLSLEDQQVLIKAAQEAGDYNTKLTMEAEEYYRNKFKELGNDVIEPNLEAFRNNAKPVYQEFESTWGKGLYEKIQAVK
ncbi:MAG: TRAP-type transport system periplasmic protein [Bacillota bacterium]|nr:TRAP-type transport system periplasmic protein [Bacillota bacterium]